MDARQLFREWRIWFLIVALVGSFIAIGPHYGKNEQGETVIKTNIKKGLDLEGGARVLIQPDLSEVKQGEQQKTMDQIINTLKTRIQAFGLEGMTIRQVGSFTSDDSFIQIEMAGANQSQLKELIERQGRFTASMSLSIPPNGGEITFGEETFNIEAKNESLVVHNKSYKPNQTFKLNTSDFTIPVTYVNQTENGYNLKALAFTGEDVSKVDTDPTRSGVFQRQGVWRFRFQVLIEDSAAERFKVINQNFEKGPGGPQRSGNLQGTKLVLELDNNEISRLNVGNVFKDQKVTNPSIRGSGESEEKAYQDMNELKSVLRSGALPVPITISSSNEVSAKLGQRFTRTAVTAILLAVLAVGIVIFIRYQNPKVVVPITLTGFSEIVILLGIFSSGVVNPITVAAILIPTAIGLTVGLKEGELSSIMLPLGAMFIIGMMQFSPALDLAAIAGIIAAVGTGTDDQIIITDESAGEKIKSLKKRLERAFFIIFTSAASTIGAMIPVTQIGAGAVQGFALTTIAGVIVGIGITRPAYAKILEHLEQ